MALKFLSIDDFNLEDKIVLVRVDINSPVDPINGKILDNTRIELHAKTIKEIARKGAKTVVLAHQSRPGKKDFTSNQTQLSLSYRFYCSLFDCLPDI